jgi:hypothetical protein|tara:strand:+ start:466 stop:714 length:249 start_codon:yes stop_codon:yes gene_type:complete
MNAITNKMIPDELNILQRRVDKLSLLILTSDPGLSSLSISELDSITNDINSTKEEMVELINKSIARLNKLLFLLKNREENYV